MRLLLFAVAVCVLSAQQAEGESPNSLSSSERAAGFVALFNGTDFDGWQHAGNWKIEDGVLVREGKGGNLVYSANKMPDDFDLRFEWKVANGSNSGVYYRPTQYEYQVLDNTVHIDGKNPRTSAAALYFCMQPSADETKPVGQWNSGRVVGKGTVIQHWLNGVKVVHFDYADPKWKSHVDLLAIRGGDLTARGANLNFQDHGDPVWYRNIRLRELSADDQIDATPVTPATLSAESLEHERKKIAGILQR